MKIRKATEADLNSINEIYEAIHDNEEKGLLTIGWIRGVYPTKQTAQAALERNDMFVGESEGRIIASAIINQAQVDEYKLCPFLYKAKDEEIMIIHTLVVHPDYSKMGIGTSFIAFYEEYAKNHSCTVLRIDTQQKNTAARALYKKLGYREAGIVPCNFSGIPDVSLVCLEKQII